MRPIILICYQYTTVLFWFWVLYILLIKVASLSFLGITHVSISQNPDWILPPHETLSFFLSLTHVVLSPSPSLSPCLSSSFDDLSIITPYYLLFCIHVTLDFPIRFKHVRTTFVFLYYLQRLEEWWDNHWWHGINYSKLFKRYRFLFKLQRKRKSWIWKFGGIAKSWKFIPCHYSYT